MSKKVKKKKTTSRPKYILVLLIFIFNFGMSSYAQDSNYYDVSDSNRPPSAFSICCCSKENDTGVQVIYTCKYIESEKCPSKLKQYKTAINECPGNLIFTKHSPEQNKDSADN